MAEYLKIPEVAQRLDVSEKTARRMVRGGKLPSVFIGGAYRVSEEDLKKYLEAAKVQPGDGSPKVQAPLPLENEPAGQSKASDEERLLQYLRAWRAFVWEMEHHWEQDPPTSREALFVLKTMQALIDEGVFDHPLEEKAGFGTDLERYEQLERKQLFMGIKALNHIADGVEVEEEAKARRANFQVITDRMAESA